MRRLVVSAALVSVLAVSGHAAQDSQRRFRAGVDLITIDVAAVDAKGRPVEDLRPGDFIVKVDGKPRPAVSAELIKVDRGKPAPRPNDLITTNQSPPNARRIIIAVDQTLITPGTITPLLRTASQFVDRLLPSDSAAFIAFPEPGPRVDFTTDKAAVHKAMQSISIGQPAKVSPNIFNISWFEALTITGSESIQNKSIMTGALPGPIMEKVLARVEEAGLSDLCPPPPIGCPGGIYNESMIIADDARREGTISLGALEALLKELVPLEGPKSMVLFSAGMVSEDPSLLDGVKRLAAAARTTINVIVVDRDRGELTSQTNTRSFTPLIDRSFELQGLETIADVTNGTLDRGIAAGAGIFERLESELSAWYLVAVERQPGDPESQRIEVDVKRRGVTVRSNKNAIAVNAATRRRPLDELLNEALSSPFTISGVPLRVSTFAQRDADPTKYRVRVATEIGQPGEPAGEFALGYVLTNEKGRVTSGGSRRTLAPTASGPNQLLLYDTSLAVAVAPGNYLLRFGVVDAAGRRGTLVRRVELPPLTNAEVQTSDLIVGNLPAEGETLAPRVEPQITASELAGYLELYVADTASANLAVTLDIAEGEASPALATKTLTLRPGDTASFQVATGFVPATMTPGRYVARATVTRDGVTVKTLSRPFTIVRDPAVVSRATTRTRGVPITPELKQRAAAYVAGVVNGLASVVGEEEFTLSKPDRRVTSELVLAQYPGRRRDWIPHRDVIRVNGKPIEGRKQRLVDLFETPTDTLREQARRIMLSGEQHVPLAFNPMFVLGFLQSDFQSRFELTVSDAGADWPREVKAVTFVEVGRPTLLRAGAFGDFDAPTRGTAWIEQSTGRILQTELEVGRGRGAPMMVTTFKLDDRLQVTVPVEMRTQNPDGLATYRNFRRFDVATETAIPAPAAQR